MAKQIPPLIGGPYTSMSPPVLAPIVAGQTWVASRPRRRKVVISEVNPDGGMDIIVADENGCADAIWEPTFRARYALSDSEGGAS